MKKIALLSLVFCVAACSSLPKFQKLSAENQYGYWSEKLSDPPATFDVFVKIPKTEDTKYIRRYLVVGAAQACHSSGFEYFDISHLDFERAEGEYSIYKTLALCAKNGYTPVLNISFADKPAELADGMAAIVESLNNKKPTGFQVGDKLLSLNGQRVLSNYHMRKAVVQADRSGKKTIEVELFRGDQKVKFDESIIQRKIDWKTSRVVHLHDIYQ